MGFLAKRASPKVFVRLESQRRFPLRNEMRFQGMAWLNRLAKKREERSRPEAQHVAVLLVVEKPQIARVMEEEVALFSVSRSTRF